MNEVPVPLDDTSFRLFGILIFRSFARALFGLISSTLITWPRQYNESQLEVDSSKLIEISFSRARSVLVHSWSRLGCHLDR